MFKKYELLESYSAYIEPADMGKIAASIAQVEASIMNKARYDAEKMRKFKEWVLPEEIAKRLAIWQVEAEEAKQKGIELKKAIREAQGLPLDDPELPDPLPKHMQGQSESTIRAMLRQESWAFDKESFKWVQK